MQVLETDARPSTYAVELTLIIDVPKMVHCFFFVAIIIANLKVKICSYTNLSWMVARRLRKSW